MAAATSLAGPTVRDIVEFTQIVQPTGESDAALHDQVSPDGSRAFILIRKADVASDKNRYEIQLLDLSPQRLAAQRAPAPVTVFSRAFDKESYYFTPAIQDVRWHDDRTLTMLARLDGQSFQVYRLDLSKRQLVQLTHEADLIVSYAVSKDLRRVVCAVQVPNPPQREGAHDVVVGHQSLWSVKFGQHDLRAQDRIYRYVVADVKSPRAGRTLGAVFKHPIIERPTVSISPDGRWALLPRYEPDRLSMWTRQYARIEELERANAPFRTIDPLQYFSKPLGYVPRRMTAWRLDDGAEQTVLDAPDDARPGAAQFRRDRLWQGSGESVVLAGTYLPSTSDGNTSSASHVIEYWPDSGRWTDIATLEDTLGDAQALPDGFSVTDGTKRREFHRQAAGGWYEAEASLKAASSWSLRKVQSLNQPADFYAAGPAGQTVRLTSLNPQFDAQSWGAMHPYAWRDSKGRQWRGGLMSGRGMDEHTRYPLLIQTYGFSPDRFYLGGPNLFDATTSAFAGRAFLQDGILVLDMPSRPPGEPPGSERQILESFNEGVRSAVNTLVKEGRVDPMRVGIIGWSTTGERVLNLLTFGDVPIRAATIADGDANTFFSYTITYGVGDFIWERKEEINEGIPVGDKLANWLRDDPSMHTDCVHSALRIETYGPLVQNNWDEYALLRRQYKPVELIVIPDGAHSLLGPGDRMASLQGNVDWYGFWLAGLVRTEPLLSSETIESVASQFARWREMEKLKTADDTRPRCAR